MLMTWEGLNLHGLYENIDDIGTRHIRGLLLENKKQLVVVTAMKDHSLFAIVSQKIWTKIWICTSLTKNKLIQVCY